MNPFARNYTPQLDSAALSKEARRSKAATARREAGMRSEDPDRRRAAIGTVEGLKSCPTKADKSTSRM